jgi:hypothetical protein
MTRLGKLTFAILIAAQAAHSVEGYVFRLFDVLLPARLVSGLFGGDLATGSAIANVGIVLAGAVSWGVAVRAAPGTARGIAWFWALLELANGVGHILLAAGRGGYFPGLLTAPVLVAVSAWLGYQLLTAPDFMRAESRR